MPLPEHPADLFAEALGILVRLMLDFDFEEKIGPVHRYFYTKEMQCAICETRRPKRFCPGVRGDICPTCCGNEREMTVECPLDCEYLMEARKHDRRTEPIEFPNRDIEVSEKLIRENEPLLIALSGAIFGAAMETQGLVDNDVREALDALIRTYLTLRSGVYYESRPTNPLAGTIYTAVQDAAERYRKEEQEHLGVTRTRDADVLGLLVFLQHFEIDRNNGRKRGRAFLSALHGFFSDLAQSQPPDRGSSLVLP